MSIGIFLSIIVLGMYSLYILFTKKNCVFLRFIPLLNTIVTIFLLVLLPFTESYSKFDFAINYSDRFNVIKYVESNTKINEYDDIGDFKMIDIDKYELPYMYKYLSLDGTVKVIYQNDAINIDFPLYRFINKGIHIVYSSNNTFSYNILKYTNEDVLNISRPRNNWFIVRVDEI
jgi:hypothetical protein